MEDDDVTPQDLSYRSHPHRYNTQLYNKLNGHNFQMNYGPSNSNINNSGNNIDMSYSAVNNVSELLSHPSNASSLINGNANSYKFYENPDMPIDLATDRQIRNIIEPLQIAQPFVDTSTANYYSTASIIGTIPPTASAVTYEPPQPATVNLKRKHSEPHLETNQKTDSMRPGSPKHLKLFRPFSDDSSPESVKQPSLEIENNTQQKPQQQQQEEPAQQNNEFDSLLNPSLFKSMDEMKHFLKHHLQFSDLGKLFGNIDLSAGNEQLGECAQFLGLQPTVKFKCFKCDKSTFLSLAELKDHQATCLKNNNQNHDTGEGDVGDDTVNKENRSGSDQHHHHHQQSTAKNTNSISDEPTPTKQIDTKIRITRKVFLCSACGTYYENWNLFHHMREVHNKFICLHCLGIFQSADRLVHHLEAKHTTKPNVYEHKEQLLAAIKDQCYLMCCVCEHIFSEHDNFTSHSCENYIQPCNLCGLKFIHRPNCQAAASMQMHGRQTGAKHHKDRDKPKTKLESGNSGGGGGATSKTKKERKSNKANGFIAPIPHQNGGDNVDSLQNGFDNQSTLLPTTQFTDASASILHPFLQSPLISQPIAPSLDVPLRNNTSWPTTKPDNPDLYNMSATLTGNNNQMRISSQKKLFDAQGFNDEAEDYMNDPPDLDSIHVFAQLHGDLFNRDDELGGGDKILNGSHSDAHDESGKTEQSFNEDDEQIEEEEEGEEEEEEQEEEEEEQEEEIPVEKPLLVPKLKLKISKEFQKAVIESEESSTESDDELFVDESATAEDDEPTEEHVNTENEREHFSAEPPEIEQQPNEGIERTKEADEEHKLEEEVPLQIDAGETQSDEEQMQMSPEPPPPETEISPVVQPEEPIIEEPEDGILVAGDEVFTLDLLLKQPLDRINIREFLKNCLNAAYPICLYCNHARQIPVNGNSLALHFIANHKFSATVDSITAEELHPPTIVQRMKSALDELEDVYFNLNSYDSSDPANNVLQEKLYECFQCRFQSRIHKELYLHNRKMHLKSVLMCIMCKANFYTYSELVCHMCPGAHMKLIVFELKFRCVLCNLDQIPSAFRLMVHLRKKHSACDVCLEECHDQSKLSSHVWKHKLHHLCYRCNVTYRNKLDITKHLFWKHGTESVLCKRCLQKKWPHVYHFCIPPSSFVCEICSLSFSRAVALKVHKRLHSEDAPYPCTEDGCDKKFISRKLLLKHINRHSMLPEPEPIEIVKEEPLEIQKEETEECKEEPVAEVKQKPKKAKKHKAAKEESNANMIDIINMPAPNLSESDSSEESDTERPSPVVKPSTADEFLFANISVDATVVDEDDHKPAPVVDIWENFKTYQASQMQDKLDDEEEPPPVPPPILHVVQSDHDYCLMYKILTKLSAENEPEKAEDLNLNEITESVLQKIAESSPKPIAHARASKHTKASSSSPKKGRSPKKGLPKSASESSSGNSSDSDSSCSCGSNCSCTTSSGGSTSSSSSSSDDSDSDSSTKQRKKAMKKEKRDRLKSETSSKANLSDNIDVVTTEKPTIRDPDSVIYESDLETDESETDEDFYDEHPQKLACQMLAEKRKALMLQTCPTNPLNNYDIVENSRPSTPSLPEEIVKQKKVKTKKRKKDRKNSSKSIPPLKINIPRSKISRSRTDQPKIPSSTATVLTSPTPPTAVVPMANEPIKLKLSTSAATTPTSIHLSKPRLSTGSSCSDIDTPLKRSKRRRIPNKFYGYTSDDDENTAHSSNSVLMNAFKPQPPPNLTWHKEDLPRTPTVVRTPPIRTIIKIPKATSTPSSPKHDFNKTIASPAPLPVTPAVVIAKTPPLIVPPIIIRPNRVINQPQPPPIEPRVPAVPVHHIIPPSDLLQGDSGQSGESSSSDSSDEGALQITYPATQPANSKPSSQQAAPTTPATATTIHPIIDPYTPPIPAIADQIRYPIMPPAGCRPAREGESVYCYCRCPYDEVSEMIACDGTDCPIEWFHFECVNIMVPPKGTWYCPQCRPKYINDKQQFQDVT